MFLRVLSALFIGMTLLQASLSLAQSEDERRKGFYEHREEEKEFDLERIRGLKAYLKEQADWEEQRKKDVAADKNRKKEVSPVEGGPEYKADRKDKLEDYEEYEKSREAYLKKKQADEPHNASEKAKREKWAMEEYGLDKERPRFDIAKRALYGGKPGAGSSGSSGGGSGGGRFTPPSPPPFDDFGDNYVPPPPPPMEPFEPPPPEAFPAPVPPPPFPAPGGDFDNGFYPPPPPPPMPDTGGPFDEAF
jgi:hypothetical protein